MKSGQVITAGILGLLVGLLVGGLIGVVLFGSETESSGREFGQPSDLHKETQGLRDEAELFMVDVNEGESPLDPSSLETREPIGLERDVHSVIDAKDIIGALLESHSNERARLLFGGKFRHRENYQALAVLFFDPHYLFQAPTSVFALIEDIAATASLDHSKRGEGEVSYRLERQGAAELHVEVPQRKSLKDLESSESLEVLVSVRLPDVSVSVHDDGGMVDEGDQARMDGGRIRVAVSRVHSRIVRVEIELSAYRFPGLGGEALYTLHWQEGEGSYLGKKSPYWGESRFGRYSESSVSFITSRAEMFLYRMSLLVR